MYVDVKNKNSVDPDEFICNSVLWNYVEIILKHIHI